MKPLLTPEQKEIKKLKAILDKRNLQILSLTQQNEELDALNVKQNGQITKGNETICKLHHELGDIEDKLNTVTNTLNSERDKHSVKMTEYFAVRDKLQNMFGEVRHQRQYYVAQREELQVVIESLRKEIRELEEKSKSNEPIEIESAD